MKLQQIHYINFDDNVLIELNETKNNDFLNISWNTRMIILMIHKLFIYFFFFFINSFNNNFKLLKLHYLRTYLI